MSETPTQEREPLNVHAVLAIMLDQLSDIAWQKLGLRHDAMTGKLDQDLGQAKLAIDVCGDLVSRIEPELDEADKRQVQSLLRDLKLNYVEWSKPTS